MRLLIIPPFLITILFLSGCLGRAALYEISEKTVTGNTISLNLNPVANESKIITVKASDIDAKYSPAKYIIQAHRANGLRESSSGSPNGPWTSSREYNIQYRDTVINPNKIEGQIKFTNSSQRGFDLTNTLIRMESNNKDINISYPPDVTNKKRLEPEEGLVFTFTINDADKLKTNDAITVKVYELPKDISSSGDINARVNVIIQFKVKVQQSDQIESIYWVKEKRYWVHEEQTYARDRDDPALKKYLR